MTARALGGALLAAALLAALFALLHPAKLGAVLRQADPMALSLVVLASFGTYPARAWRYGSLLAPLGRVPFRRLASATYLGYLAGLFVPRVGEVLRPWLVARRQDVPTAAAFAGMVLERLVDVAAILSLTGIGLLAGGGPDLGAPWRHRLEAASLAAGLAALVVLAVLMAVNARPQGTLRALSACLRPLPERAAVAIATAAQSFVSGLAVLRAPAAHLLLIAAQSLLVWLFVAAGFHAANRAFGLELPFHAALVTLGFVVVGVTLPTPSGAGGFHAAYVLALSTVYGASPERAAAAALACHGLTSLTVLAVGLVLLPGEGLTLRDLTRRPGTGG